MGKRILIDGDLFEYIRQLTNGPLSMPEIKNHITEDERDMLSYVCQQVDAIYMRQILNEKLKAAFETGDKKLYESLREIKLQYARNIIAGKFN